MQARLHRRTLFGIAAGTVVLWLAALLLWTAQDIAAGEAFPAPYRRLLAATFASGLLFSALLAGALMATQGRPRLVRVVTATVAALAAALLHGWLDAVLMADMRVAIGLSASAVPKLFIAGLMPFVLIYGLYAVSLALVLSAVAIREAERRLAEARAAAQEAELSALRFQLNPHFLFNTLNAISSLIVTGDNAAAETMTVRLSSFLRASLESDPNEEVSVEEELATVQAYLDIERARFGERLAVEMECPTELLGAAVPSYLLQPLVENAVKYAVAPSRRAVTVAVRVGCTADRLRIRVEDSGASAFAGALPRGGTGVGLANVRDRLDAFYGAAARLEAVATAGGFVAAVELPLREAAQARAAA